MSLSSMSRNPASAIVRRAVLAVAAFGAACSDHITSAPARVPGSSDRVVTCQGDVAARTLSCGMSSAPAPVGSPPGFSADLIVGGENIDVLLQSTNVSYDPATQIFQADVTVQNLLTPTLGTPDGNSVSGVKVFFHAGPSVVSGSGAVTVANADGAGTFTGTNQPYFLYGQTLPTGQVSTAQFMTGTNYPVRISGANLCWHGGEIIGQLPPSTSWPTMIKTFAILVDTGTNVTVEDFSMFDFGNGVSLQLNAPNFTVRSGYYIYDRDGCVENDFKQNGTIDDVYMECYDPIADEGGFGVDGSSHLVTLKNSLVHLQPMDGVFKGTIPGTVGIFEWGSMPSTGPNLALFNNVFRVDQNSSELYLAPPPGKLVDCANNVMIWLGSGPFPEPLPLTFNGRTCYTLMTGQAGLDYWNAAVARWRADHLSLLPDIAPPVVSMFSPGIVGSTTLTG